MALATIKLISGTMLIGNACLAAYIFRIETKRDDLKAEAAVADADVAMFEGFERELLTIGERSVDIYRRASAAWRDSSAVEEQVRVNAFLDIRAWIQSINRHPDEVLTRSDMLIEENYNRYSLIYSQAQDDYSDRLTENVKQSEVIRSNRDKIHREARRVERSANLLRALMHLVTISALIVALFDAGPSQVSEV